jgi:flavin-binding protein dodecin
MSVAKVIEISASSDESFDDAIRKGIRRAAETIDDVRGAWVKDQEITVENGVVTEYLVRLKVTFVLGSK